MLFRSVLAGIAGALLAAGGEVEASAVVAAWLHQRAGALAGGVGVGAVNIADAVPAARAEGEARALAAR